METYISKMSVKGLECNPRKAAANKPEDPPIKLCLIYGKATGLKHGEDKGGNIWTALSGDFKGVNLENKKEYRSGKLFLPGGIQDVIESPLIEAEGHVDSDGKPDPRTVAIEFALEISAIAASNPIGYSYQARSLIAPQEANEMASLEKQFGYVPLPETQPVPQLTGPAVQSGPKPPQPGPMPQPAPLPEPDKPAPGPDQPKPDPKPDTKTEAPKPAATRTAARGR